MVAKCGLVLHKNAQNVNNVSGDDHMRNVDILPQVTDVP